MRKIIQFAAAASLLAGSAAAAVIPGAQSPNQKFINKLYADLLSRAPSQAESTGYVRLLAFGVTRTQIAGIVTSSNEYRIDMVQQFYNSFLHRSGSSAEVTIFVTLLQQGSTDDDIKAIILGSDEYFLLAGQTIAGFLNQLYLDVLCRPIDPAASLTFQSMIERGTTRQAVAAIVLHSLEADQREMTQLFQKFLLRSPQPAELTSFAQMLQTGAKDEVVIDLICGSSEYFQLAQ